MAGTAAPKLLREKRHKFAAEQLAMGTPFSTVVARVAVEHGCSRRQARRVVNAALAEVVGDMDSMQINALLADSIHRLQRIALRAEQCEQFGAAVGAIRSLHEFCIAPHVGNVQHGARHGRSRHG